jgi:hypothetical protein
MWKRLQRLVPTRNLATVIPIYFVGLFVLAAFLAPRIADNNRNTSPLPSVVGVTAPNITKGLAVVEPPREDLFGSNDPPAANHEEQVVQPLQEECLFTGNACVAFGSGCCPGLICVPVNETTSTCSHFQGSICLNLNMICNDRVTGVECCDDAVCTPEATGPRSRCIPAVSPLLRSSSVGATTTAPVPTSPHSALRPTATP